MAIGGVSGCYLFPSSSLTLVYVYGAFPNGFNSSANNTNFTIQMGPFTNPNSTKQTSAFYIYTTDSRG